MNKLALTSIIILFSLTFTADINAMDQASRRGFGPGEAAWHQKRDRIQELFANLNLAAEQKAKIEVLRNAHQMDIKPFQDQMLRASGELKLLWLQPNPNKGQILAKHKEIMVIRDQIQDKSVIYRLEVFKTLTPEQQEKAKVFFVEAGAGNGLKSGMGPGAGMMGR